MTANRTRQNGSQRNSSTRARNLVLPIFAIAFGAWASVATNLADSPKSANAEDEAALVMCSESVGCTEELPHCLESYDLCVECLDDTHCGEQEMCFEQVCVDSCDNSDGCENELICAEGLCRECREDAECGDPGAYCYIGPEFSACRPLCESSRDCSGPGFAPDDVCRGGHCIEVECTVPQDCLVDREFCDPEKGVCTPIQPN